MNKYSYLILLTVLIIILLIVWTFFFKVTKFPDSDLVTRNTWTGFKYYFIDDNGRVLRPKDSDTVSEGQAYAMLRAVWMNDKATFDKCYSWTENNLSRINIKFDNLLSWQWKKGQVTDLMPASDADIDYALSLIFADAIWHSKSPDGVEDYGQKAKKVLDDILKLETYLTPSGKLYLSPWILDGSAQLQNYPVNPSYYSPAHFKIFHKFTGDSRWLDLIDTTYYIFDSLSEDFVGQKGVGLVPDWCGVDSNDNFSDLEDKNTGFGYEAIRIPFRIGLDYLWFEDMRAKKFLLRFSRFIKSQIDTEKAVYCEYDYTGNPAKKYENPAFYACYYYALITESTYYHGLFLSKNQSYINKAGTNWFYQDQQDYYINCLAWLADGLSAGLIKDLSN